MPKPCLLRNPINTTITYLTVFYVHMAEKKTAPKTSEYTVRGSDLMNRIKELIKEGGIRHISIKNKEGRVILDIPLAFGIVGALIAPALAVLSTITALITECTISVERK